MTVKHQKLLIEQYEICGDKKVKDQDYLSALSSYSVAFGILLNIDYPHELKFVAQKSAQLRDKLDNCKDLFEQYYQTTLAGL